MGLACREATRRLDIDRIKGISVDTTACSVVALDNNFKPLRKSLLWMDTRSSPETDLILQSGRGDPALNVNCDGEGPLSAEWMLPKSLWIKRNEPEIWNNAQFICEKQDYLNLKLTGRYCASGCNVAARWHWNAEEACSLDRTGDGSGDRHRGRPVRLLHKIGLSDILEKWPKGE